MNISSKKKCKYMAVNFNNKKNLKNDKICLDISLKKMFYEICLICFKLF